MLPTAAFFLAFCLALALALTVTPFVIRVAWATGYLDHPEARKLHTSATALLGGGVVLLCAGSAWGVSAGWLGVLSVVKQEIWLLAGALVALWVGLWDDRFGMQPLTKLLGQIVASMALLASGVSLKLGLPPAIEIPIVLALMVGLMNAVNFLDNMNGMVAGMAALLLVVFAWHSAERGALGVATAQFALAGACVGFLRFNFPKAVMFLGDAGSLLLGYALGASALLVSQNSPAGWGQLGLVLMLGYPAFDMVFVVVNRIREGRKVYEGGKDHTNHRLANVIQCPIRTVLLVWSGTTALGLSGLAILRYNRPAPALWLSAMWLVLFFLGGRWLSSVPHSRSAPSL